MPNFKMFPPENKSSTTTIVNGRSYTASPGQAITVVDFDATTLESNGWVTTAHGGVGTTAQRPALPKKRDRFLDSTLGFIIVFDGATWRNPNNGVAV